MSNVTEELFFKNLFVSSVTCNNIEYHFQLLEKVVEEVGEEYVIQVNTDNERALKAAEKRLMDKIPHIYWSTFATHYLDLS